MGASSFKNSIAVLLVCFCLLAAAFGSGNFDKAVAGGAESAGFAFGDGDKASAEPLIIGDYLPEIKLLPEERPDPYSNTVKKTVTVVEIWGERVTITRNGKTLDYEKGMKLRQNGNYTISAEGKGQTLTISFAIKKQLNIVYILACIGAPLLVSLLVAALGIGSRKKQKL